MTYFRYLISFALLINCVSIRKEVNYGTQTIRIFSGGKQIFPDQVLFYYGNYLIEEILSIKKTTINNSVQSTLFDTSYCLINFTNDSCVMYQKFSENAPHGNILELHDKRKGVLFDQPLDSSLDYSPNFPLKDTSIDGLAYKYFTMQTKSGSPQTLTCYLIFDKTPLYHFNRKIDSDYKGVMVRMDMEDKKDNEQTSLRMYIEPHKLSADKIVVMKSWISANNWKY